MNAHARMETAEAAFLSLCLTQRRLAHQYKRWAIEAMERGRQAEYCRYRREADRLWNDAKWALSRAAWRKEQ